MKAKYKNIIKTYGDFADVVRKLKNPSMSGVYREIGISDQLGGYYLKQSVILPGKKIKEKGEKNE